MSLFSEAQLPAPSALIELYELALAPAIHGSSDVYRFHAGLNAKQTGNLVWAGNEYLALPIEAEGFRYTGNGQLPRPTLRVGNVMGTITALLLSLPHGLEGAKVTRIRTHARYLDAVNFPGNTNPIGSPDPTAEYPREVYYVDQKKAETQLAVEFELVAAFDLAGVRLPKRQVISSICQWQYKSAECGYDPTNNAATPLRNHYSVYGWAEGRNVNSGGQFNPSYYLATYGDVASYQENGHVVYDVNNVIEHYRKYGIWEGRNANASGRFDATFYLSSYHDLYGLVYFDKADNSTGPTTDECGKRLHSCQLRFGVSSRLPFGSFPGAGSFNQ